VPCEALPDQCGEVAQVVGRPACTGRADREVGQVGGARVVEEHVLGGHPPVHDPPVGGGGERGADTGGELRHLAVG
jgi:hypothetical protein